jgi:hypothetical protein
MAKHFQTDITDETFSFARKYSATMRMSGARQL